MNTKPRLRGGATLDLHTWAHENRNAPTKAEERLWEALRNRQLNGLRFRCQHSYSTFTFDFYCPAHKLIVEVDGGYHQKTEQAQHDLERDSHLCHLGFKTLRFTNEEVFDSLQSVLEKIKRSLTA